jgi:hypothetical protein
MYQLERLKNSVECKIVLAEVFAVQTGYVISKSYSAIM